MNNTIIDKTIGAFEARRKFGNQWKKTREAFFNKIRKVANKVNLTSKEAERIANEAVKSVRSAS